MPTIDQLAPAAAATDSDEFPATQNGITRKISRAQILAGVQTQLTVPSGTLVGRSTNGAGTVETISIGNNLNLVSGTLSAAASPFSIVTATSGVVPSSTDLVPLGQGGRNVSVSFGTFIRGMSGVPNLDGSQLTVTPTNGTASLTLADLTASAIVKTGGSLSGPLVLAADPMVPLQAATKQFVDTRLKRSGDTMTGALLLAGDPTIAQQAATKNYVDNQSGFPRLGFTISGPIVLAGDPVAPLNPATKSYTDLRLIRAGDTMTDRKSVV